LVSRKLLQGGKKRSGTESAAVASFCHWITGKKERKEEGNGCRKKKKKRELG
jgi:hypothetical protein